MKNLRPLLLLVLAGVSACATSQPAQDVAASRTVGLSMGEAVAIVQGFEANLGAVQAAAPPITDMAGALAVLKADRLDQFPSSVAWLAAQEGDEALAVKAQTLLAWGEAELTVGAILSETANALEHDLRAAALKKLDTAALHKRITMYRDTDQALRILAAEHVAQGFDDAQKLITKNPNDYRGFRIAADAYRLRNDWKDFNEMVQKVEAANPESNGLLFLKGVQAYLKDGDAAAASNQFRTALKNDPQFVRAQVQLVLVAPSLGQRYDELQALKKLSPDHQLVRWAGPGIEEAWASMQARMKAIQTVATNRMGADPVATPR